MTPRSTALQLQNGSRIAIIGAGPAGSLFASFALDLAAAKGLDISIALFDGKNFADSGPKGCNLCAGVISETLVDLLHGYGIALPADRVQHRIDGYRLQAKAGEYLLQHPRGQARITTVFRGNGPRLSSSASNVSFDDYLLDHVRMRSVEVISQLVRRIELPTVSSGRVRLYFGPEGSVSMVEADLLVGAFGLNTDMMNKIRQLGFGYRPPPTVRARCMELELGERLIQERFSDNILAVTWRSGGGMRLGAIVPKKDHLTINVVGRTHVAKEDLREMLELPSVRNKFPGGITWSGAKCSCAPRIAVGPARRPFSDRVVIIGDASCTRYYKNGIESAFVTARLAAEAAFNLGVSRSALKKGYFQSAKKAIIRDNRYGKMLFRIYSLVDSSALLSEIMLRVAREDQAGRGGGQMIDVLWSMYTGSVPYRSIALMFLRPKLQWRLAAMTFRVIVAWLRGRLSEAVGPK